MENPGHFWVEINTENLAKLFDPRFRGCQREDWDKFLEHHRSLLPCKQRNEHALPAS